MQFNRNPYGHAAMPDVPVYTQRQLDAALAAARKDADRYRWLRDVSAGCTNQAAPFICGAGDLSLHGDDVDAAVDAAMKAVGAA